MTIQRLSTRVERLERHAQAQEEGILHVWRLPDESVEEAFDRCEVDPADYPQVQVHVWRGGQAASRLALPPAPVWIPKLSPAIADLEHWLHEGMKHGGLPL
jgi:hypothetical protein